MEIGIISDTHSLVRPEVYDAFEGVDLILHAGDIGSHDVIIELEPIAPIQAVVGNNDSHLSHKFDEKVMFELEQRNFILQHILDVIPEEKAAGANLIKEIFVFGHSHQPMNRQVGSTLYFNPGSAGPRRFSLPITVGRITVNEETVEGKIIALE